MINDQGGSGKGKKANLNFELNLIPIFDILSVCICFLLMTVAWIQVGSLDVTQAMGSEARDKQENSPAVWAYLETGGKVVLTLKNTQGLPHHITEMVVQGEKGAVKWSAVIEKLALLQKFGPVLRTGLIMPGSTVAYEDIVRLMDEMKKYGIKDMGISPL